MKKTFGEKFAGNISGCCLVAAAVMLLYVCSHCYPQLGNYGRKLLFGVDNSPAKEAFSVLADSLEDGNSIKDSFVRSYEVLVGAEN